MSKRPSYWPIAIDESFLTASNIAVCIASGIVAVCNNISFMFCSSFNFKSIIGVSIFITLFIIEHISFLYSSSKRYTADILLCFILNSFKICEALLSLIFVVLDLPVLVCLTTWTTEVILSLLSPVRILVKINSSQYIGHTLTLLDLRKPSSSCFIMSST